MRLPWILALACAGCAVDTSTSVNVAPSAEAKMHDILEAIERLNDTIGEDVYSVRAVDSEQRIDGEIILRGRDDLGEARPHETRIGRTQKTRDGVVILIVPQATASAIAHELGHAAGLEHLPDQDNLMYRETAPNRWGLNAAQVTHLRSRF